MPDPPRIFAAGRIARAVEDLDADTLEAIARSAVDPKHAALDAILHDWTPLGAEEGRGQLPARASAS